MKNFITNNKDFILIGFVFVGLLVLAQILERLQVIEAKTYEMTAYDREAAAMCSEILLTKTKTDDVQNVENEKEN